ncbi:MAG: serine/threonine protein kinase, partial [Acidobacteria bacterium]|nr:serine/threonine protein kinase [Candidatus Sulfomarinibacter kjeldsenii]
MQDLIGRTLGHYRIVEKIGEGGMGEVYRAHDERLDRDVAVKVLHESVAQDANRLARFEREAKAVAQLAHPNILEIWDFGREGGVTYAVTELLDGQNLRQSIPPSGMPWQKVVEIGAAIADGLAAAHGKGIVHRDLKPENIFITSDGRVKILDFGLAQVKVPMEEEAETATMTPAGTVAGTVMGTMGYMSPEQLRGEPSDARSDIFALGCVLYEMLSGKAAFLRKTTAE